MKKASEINITAVTDEQIGRCYKCYDEQARAWFYMVESERDNLIEYAVKWTREHGFTCTCPAGQEGFRNCRDGVCKHVKWSLAAAKEERDYIASVEAASKPAPVAPAVKHTPVAEWSAEERRDYSLNERRARGAAMIVEAMQMARNPAKRWG